MNRPHPLWCCAVWPLLLVTSAAQLRAQDRDPAKGDPATARLKTAYERVYSAEAHGLKLLKAGDIEIVVKHDAGQTEWEDGLLWKAGFAPVIEHERPLAVPLRPATEELLMSMLGWSMGLPAWERRFANARCVQVGEATADRAIIRVSYGDDSRKEAVFSIQDGRIATVTDGVFRTSFTYEPHGQSLRVKEVTRIAIAVGDPTIPDEIHLKFRQFEDVSGATVACKAEFTVKSGDATVAFESRLTKVRGNERVPTDDVEASYEQWAIRAMERAVSGIYSAEASGLKTLRCQLVVTMTIAGRAAKTTSEAAWTPSGFKLSGDPLPDSIRRATVSMLPWILGSSAWQHLLHGAQSKLQPTTDPQRLMRISLVSGGLMNATATIEAQRLTSLDQKDRRSTHFRYEPTEHGLRVLGVEQRVNGKVQCRATFDSFELRNNVWLPSKMHISLTSPKIDADVELRKFLVNE